MRQSLHHMKSQLGVMKSSSAHNLTMTAKCTVLSQFKRGLGTPTDTNIATPPKTHNRSKDQNQDQQP